MPKVTPYILYAIPVFFILIGIEIFAARVKKAKVYRLNDAITNISCGLVQQVFAVLMRGILLFGYLFLHENFRLFDLDASKWWVWVVCFVGVDFCYYWFHRYAHEISVMWGGHIVHHQSEEYNLSVALRQGAFQGMFSWAFYLPLAFLGFDPVVFLVVAQFQTLYQFWIHTRLIHLMPKWFEFIFNTPSHHRVHHGINPKYIDRNHGGTLIIFDRMFGTFQLEEEAVVYGVTKPLESWNPVWANFDYFKDVFKLITRCKNPIDMIKVLIKGPGWRPDYLGGPQFPQPITTEAFRKYDTEKSKSVGPYVLFQYVLLLAGASTFLLFSGKIKQNFEGWVAMMWLVGIAGLIFFSTANMGALLAGKPWGNWAEWPRMALTAAVLAFFSFGTIAFIPILVGMTLLAIGSGVWLRRLNASV